MQGSYITRNLSIWSKRQLPLQGVLVIFEKCSPQYFQNTSKFCKKDIFASFGLNCDLVSSNDMDGNEVTAPRIRYRTRQLSFLSLSLPLSSLGRARSRKSMQISDHPFPIYGALKRIFFGWRSARERNPRICLDFYHTRTETTLYAASETSMLSATGRDRLFQ